MRRLFGAVMTRRSTHLQRIEGESIQIMHEVVAESARPVLRHAAGKYFGVVTVLEKHHG